MTNRFAVIGDPVAHSLSPEMHRAALRAARIDGTYDAHLVHAHQLAAHVDWLRDQGYRGFNVTIPHKEKIAANMDEVSQEAARVGAVNTVVCSEGRLIGHNTDVPGFRAALATFGLHTTGRPAVILGAGGAARGVAHALLAEGARIAVVGRSRAKAASLAASMGDSANALSFDDPDFSVVLAGADLLVNATPLGMDYLPHACPVPDSVELRPRTAVIDLIYGRETPLLLRARSVGCRVMDGLEMLVQQGAASFRLWTGTDPDLEVMRSACQRRMREVSACSVS